MIFVAVGTQLPFDRLIAAVDEWAGHRPDVQVFAQVGPTALEPRHIEYRDFLAPGECRRRMAESTAIVAHAGIGTIVDALELGRPILIMPRRATLGEQRNDHQVATARRFAKREGITVAFDERELPAKLEELDELGARQPIGEHAPDGFTDALRSFIERSPGRAPTRAGIR